MGEKFDEVLTPQQVEDEFSIPKGTLGQWRFWGKGPEFFQSTADRVFYYRKDIEEYVKEDPDGYIERRVKREGLIWYPRSIPGASVLIHALAVKKGWWDGNERNIPELLCLIHSEVSEALEAYRDGNDKLLAEELADIVIRTFDMAEGLGVDIYKEIARKHIRNQFRPYRHGGKRC